MVPVSFISAHNWAADARAGVCVPDFHVVAWLWNAFASALRAIPVEVWVTLFWLTNTFTFFSAENLTSRAALRQALACAGFCVEVLFRSAAGKGWVASARARFLIKVIASDALLHIAVASTIVFVEAETRSTILCFINTTAGSEVKLSPLSTSIW